MTKAKNKNKNKINKSVKNRFVVTPNGKVLRRSAFNRHLKRKKSKKQTRRLKKKQEVKGSLAKKIKKLLGYK